MELSGRRSTVSNAHINCGCDEEEEEKMIHTLGFIFSLQWLNSINERWNWRTGRLHRR